MNRPARGRLRSEVVVIKELAPIRDAPGRQLAVRILETSYGRRLDVREYVEGDRFTGYTKKGICITLDDLNALLEQRDEIVQHLMGGVGGRG